MGRMGGFIIPVVGAFSEMSTLSSTSQKLTSLFFPSEGRSSLSGGSDFYGRKGFVLTYFDRRKDFVLRFGSGGEDGNRLSETYRTFLENEGRHFLTFGHHPCHWCLILITFRSSGRERGSSGRKSKEKFRCLKAKKRCPPLPFPLQLLSFRGI